jgi:hypothetical protein
MAIDSSGRLIGLTLDRSSTAAGHIPGNRHSKADGLVAATPPLGKYQAPTAINPKRQAFRR